MYYKIECFIKYSKKVYIHSNLPSFCYYVISLEALLHFQLYDLL